MANTTNYNWETPDDTDLVKDGAAAIRTLGSSIDTTTKNLNPETTTGDIAYRSATANTNTRLGIGTTGQVLTVAGGVPTWATSDDANAIQNAIVDAKGDIVAASANDTPARLAVGTDNHRLIAASGETTGLKYVADTQNTVVDAEGDLLVGDSADTLQRLAIGSNTHVLTVDTAVDGKIKWAAPAAGGGMTLLSTTTLTGNSTITLSTISQDYKNLQLVIRDFFTDNGSMLLRINGDTNNVYCATSTNSSASNTVFAVAAAGSIVLNNGVVDQKNADRDAHAVYNFYDYTQALDQIYDCRFMINGSPSDNPMVLSYAGAHFPSTPLAISSITIFSNGAGNINGTALLYGVK